MKKFTFAHLFCSLFFLGLFFTSCLPPIPPTPEKSFYGDWRLSRVSGGIAGDGSGYKKDFTRLVLEKGGNYTFYNQSQIAEFGKFNLTTPNKTTPKLSPIDYVTTISFVKDPSSIAPVQLNSGILREIKLIGKTGMKIEADVNDGFAFEFINHHALPR